MTKITDPRQLAVVTLNELEESEDFLREVLDFHIGQNALKSIDQGLYTELVYGTVRMRDNLDYIISLFSSRPLRKIQASILNILRLGVYQILYLDRVPESAAVNEAVKLARLFGHEGVAKFANAVLRQVVRKRDSIRYPELEADPVEHISLKYSFPRWIVDLWLNWWGRDDTLALCAAMNESPQMHIRVNTLKATPLDVRHHLKGQGISVGTGRFVPEILEVSPASAIIRDPWLEYGKYYIQDESSALAAHALQVKPGQLVYDLCSAPGGKSSHLAQLMADQGKIVSFDVNAARLKLVDENAKKLGISIIETRIADATKDLQLPPASRVLVDAPCSGLGTMRHRPDIRWRKGLDEIRELVTIQRTILTRAANYVAEEGLLLYTTCTLTKFENEDVTQWFLENHPQFEPFLLPSWFPFYRERTWNITLFPHIQGTDGFFLAIFRKKKLSK